jgi:subtilisin-like proprotein convertase family protein
VAPTFDPDSGEEVTPAALAESYVNDFGGTSAAAPIVSGAVALMLDARRWLNWREVQEILMKTAQRIDEGHPDWYQNAAGFWFNHEYGAGLVDVEAAVNLVNAIPLTPPSNGIYLADRGEPLEEEVFDVQAIPDGDGSSYILTFDLSKEPNRSVEHVELYTTIIGERRADLDVVLVSPSGTQSVLAESHQNSTERSISDWTFMTVRNWGEGSAGKWHLRITDRIPGNQARFNNAVLRVHGPEDAEAPLLTGPVLISDRVINGVEGVQLDYSFDVEGVTSIQVNNLPDGLVFNSEELTLTGVPAEGGVTNTELILSGPDGVNTTSLSISIRPVTFALGAAVEQPDRISTANGDLEWDFEFSETLDGVDSLGSPFGVPENLQARF